MNSIQTRTSQLVRNSPHKRTSFFKSSRRTGSERLTPNSSRGIYLLQKKKKTSLPKYPIPLKKGGKFSKSKSKHSKKKSLKKQNMKILNQINRPTRKTAPAKSGFENIKKTERERLKIERNHFHIDLSKAVRRGNLINSDRVMSRKRERDEHKLAGFARALNQTSDAKRSGFRNSDSVVKALKRVFRKNKLKEKEGSQRFAWLLKEKDGGRGRLTDRTKNIIGKIFFFKKY